MTPEAVVDSAYRKGIRLLAITDHHSVQNITAAQEQALNYQGEILVIAGVEVTTGHGHLLAYFSDVAAAGRFIVRVNPVDVGPGNDGHVSASMADVLTEAERLGGICVGAHIDRLKSGFETRPGYATWKRDILTHRGLYGLEFDDIANAHYYSDDDRGNDGAERRKLLVQRRERVSRPDLARIQSSDAHSLDQFSSSTALTRVKVDELSYESFITAFKDPQARVRIVASLPDSYPCLIGSSIEGGFLDGESMHFSRNLNTLFGGRGTGKSTAIRSIAYALGRDDDVAGRSDCPDRVTVFAQDASGLTYRFTRDRGDTPRAAIVTSEGETTVTGDCFPLEYYSQNALSRVSDGLSSDTHKLQEFLDQHCALLDLKDRDSQLEATVNELASQLVPLELEAAKLPATLSELRKVDVRLKAAEEGNLKAVAAAQQRLANEVRLLSSIQSAIEQSLRAVRLRNAQIDYAALVSESGPLLEVPSSLQARISVEAAIDTYNKKMAELEAQAKAAHRQLIDEVAGIVLRLRQRHAAVQTRITNRLAELQRQGLKGSIRDLNDQLRQRSKLADLSVAIKSQRPRLQELRQDHQAVLSELRKTRTEIIAKRKEQLLPINRSLARTIQDFLVVFLYDAVDVERYRDFVLTVMHGSYFPDVAADRLTRSVAPEELARLIRERDDKGLRDVLESADIEPRWSVDFQQRFDRLKVYRLEAIWRPPLPRVKIITRTEPRTPIDPATLSDGQRHTILLTVAMLSQAFIPLIIDQPEDDLDNAFIYSTVVGVLREVKERRQVLVVTHNANIAVLGDSEMMFPMKRVGERGASIDRGSIDRVTTRDAVQAILEGGRAAFIRRAEMYNIA